MGEFAIGQGVSRFEDPRLIQGGGRYVDDIKLPGMAHGVVLRSPHANAKIKSIDTAAAKAAREKIERVRARSICIVSLSTSCPALCRASTPYLDQSKAWMAGTSPRLSGSCEV